MSALVHSLTLHDEAGVRQAPVVINHAVIAGWTGRDRVAVEHHIKELEALGIARPATTPIYYRIAAARMTSASSIEVSGGGSSGEVEFALLRHDGRLWVGVGSDHTDREVEAYGVTVSKQMCDKPMAADFWAYDQVAPHWDQLRLASFIREEGALKPYQDGPVTTMLPPETLLTGYGDLPEGGIMFCGTLAAIGGIRAAGHFSFSLVDPVLGRRIDHGYDIVALPVAG